MLSGILRTRAVLLACCWNLVMAVGKCISNATKPIAEVGYTFLFPSTKLSVNVNCWNGLIIKLIPLITYNLLAKLCDSGVSSNTHEDSHTKFSLVKWCFNYCSNIFSPRKNIKSMISSLSPFGKDVPNQLNRPVVNITTLFHFLYEEIWKAERTLCTCKSRN